MLLTLAMQVSRDLKDHWKNIQFMSSVQVVEHLSKVESRRPSWKEDICHWLKVMFHVIIIKLKTKLMRMTETITGTITASQELCFTKKCKSLGN